MTEQDYAAKVRADLPKRVIVDQHGHYWRDFGTYLSMPPVSDENVETTTEARYLLVDEGIEWLVDRAVRAGIITASRAAELLGVSLRDWRERARLLAAPAPSEPDGHSCDWPGCSGQCHTGPTCPCHPVPSEPGLDALDHRYCLADECWHTDAPAPSKPGLRKAALIVARLNIPRGTTGQGVRRLVLKALDRALAAPAPSEPGLDAAWAEAEAVLPEGWTLFGVTRPGEAEHYWASAHGPIDLTRCDKGVEHREYPRENGYGTTPAAALLALAARLRGEQP